MIVILEWAGLLNRQHLFFFLLFAIADAWIVSNFPAASSSNCGDDAMISMLKFF